MVVDWTSAGHGGTGAAIAIGAETAWSTGAAGGNWAGGRVAFLGGGGGGGGGALKGLGGTGANPRNGLGGLGGMDDLLTFGCGGGRRGAGAQGSGIEWL
jgi:hypothetical protein